MYYIIIENALIITGIILLEIVYADTDTDTNTYLHVYVKR